MHCVVLLALLLFSPILHAATAAYTGEDVLIPMRDGLRLHAVVLRPAHGAPHAGDALPILLDRTPYGASSLTAEDFVKRYPEFAAAGYIFVREDIRGRYRSEGTFVMMRPLAAHHDARLYPQDVDESTDAYDTAGWLVANVPHNNGRVGVLGISYDGFLTAMAGIDPHPAVKAISPQAPMTDVWLGDDFFHNGAFRETYGYDYAFGMETGKENAFSKLDRDAYDYFLDAGSFAGAIEQSGVSADTLPTWQAFLTHPAYDEYWRQRAVQPHLDRVAVPTLEVGGYWDQEDMWGPQAEYAALKPHDSRHEVFLTLGPWFHGEWAGEARTLGVLDFGQATGDNFRVQVEEPFFEHYLRPERHVSLPPGAATSFQTGSNRWMHYAAWPPEKNVHTQPLYLGPARGLGFTPPSTATNAASDADSSTAYTSDPAHPVPYRARPIEATYAPSGSHWRTWLAEDQRPATARADVASWQTPVLDRGVTVTGDIMADLFASTSGADSDWVVKLIDVYPDDPKQGRMAGYQLMIAEEIFRGRYRESFSHPQAIPADTVEEYKFSLHAADHVFLTGHRLMVEVQSSWFPLYDRNPQTFVPNIMQARPGDYRPATQRIYWSSRYPSHLDLPLAGSD
jgi:putative CocE/NonD family hydrolase